MNTDQLSTKVETLAKKLHLNLKVVVSVIVLLIILVTAAFFVYQNYNQKGKKDIVEVPDEIKVEEPDAPISSTIVKNEIPAELKNLEVTQKISNVTYSSNYFTTLSIDQNNTTDSSYDLTLFNPDGTKIKDVAKKVLKVGSINKDYLYYQTIAGVAGIYRYEIATAKSELIIDTADPKTFDNISFVNENQYIYIQQRLGKLGFATILPKSDIQIDQQNSDVVSNYARGSAHQFVSISPNRNFFAVLFSDPKSETSKVRIYRINQKNLNEIKTVYFETDLAISPKAIKSIEDVFQWSSDEKYLSAGDAGLIIDISNKKALINSEQKLFQIRISPDSKKVLFNNLTDNSVKVIDLQTLVTTNIPLKDLSNLSWFDSENFFLIIGTKLYNYNLVKQELTFVDQDSARYNFFSPTVLSQSHLLLKDSKTIKLINNVAN